MAIIRDRYGRDWLIGTREDDQFYGYDGFDTFVHSPGNDTYYGGADAHDQVNYSYAGSGIWVDLWRGVGTDGEGGKEYFYDIEDIVGSHFNDRISGDNEPNQFNGSDGDDILIGYGGIDSLSGEEGDDRLYGGTEGDYLRGGDDDDLLVGEGGGDRMWGGDGIDTVSYAGSLEAVHVRLGPSGGYARGGHAEGDLIYDVENITGSYGDDELTGDASRNVLKGDRGNDVLHGGGDGDELNGGEGFDFASYSEAAEGLRVDLRDPETNTGDAAGDTFTSIEHLSGSQYGDTLLGDDNPNIIVGDDGADFLYGRGGSDRLVAFHGDILVDGGGDLDTVDFAGFSESTEGYTVSLGGTIDGSAVSSYGTIVLRSIEAVIGSSQDDTLTGSMDANLLVGGFGDDIIDGQEGDDTLTGGGNSDTFKFNHLGEVERNQHDTIQDFEPGVDRIDLHYTPVQNFNDLFTFGDRYMEQVGNDVLIHTSVEANTSILLRNVQMSSLTSADFLF